LVTGFLAPKKKGGRISPQEIISLARLGRREGAIEFMEEKIIENILVLDEKKASDIMTPRTVIFSLSAEFTLEEARKEAGAWHHSRVPVYKDDPEDIVGFVMRRDVYNAIADGQKGKHLSELMRPIHFVPETARADVLFKDFLEKRQHQFVVIDEYGGVAGLVTLEDVLEEIIGREIVDEFDPAIDMAELARKRRKQVVGKTA
jgi:CBS domain containing-hemolysin-like protein